MSWAIWGLIFQLSYQHEERPVEPRFPSCIHSLSEILVESCMCTHSHCYGVGALFHFSHRLFFASQFPSLMGRFSLHCQLDLIEDHYEHTSGFSENSL